MFYIDRVEIDGFWGKYKAQTGFSSDVNVLIGRNGTGKTTFMNLLEAVLRADLKVLAALEFNKITLKLKSHGKDRTISVTKNDAPGARHGAFPLSSLMALLTFKVAQKSFQLPLFTADYQRRYRTSSAFRKDYEELKRHLDEIINVASLSVHRASHVLLEDDFSERRPSAYSSVTYSPVDERLEALMQRLTSYQLTLSDRAGTVSAELQRGVLESMLYNPEFDALHLDESEDVEPDEQKTDLVRAYQELSAFDKNVSAKIDAHVAAIAKSTQAARSKEPILVDDVMPLPLLRRTQHIIALSRKAEAQKKEIFQPIREFERTVREFIADKEVQIISSGDLILKKEGKMISVTDLSSGEKQLLILLTETLLQRNEPFIFLADEPELSLHIAWQAKIISSIKRLNRNAQVIVATHSPEVAGGWQEGVIDMEDIVHAERT